MAGGRPQKEIDWKLLDALIVWASQEYCAEQLDMHIGTLAEKIKDKFQMSFPEYKHKRQEGLRINLLKKQYDVAMQGNVTMLIWLGKQHLNQSEKQTLKVTREQDLSNFTDDELLELSKK